MATTAEIKRAEIMDAVVKAAVLKTIGVRIGVYASEKNAGKSWQAISAKINGKEVTLIQFVLVENHVGNGSASLHSQRWMTYNVNIQALGAFLQLFGLYYKPFRGEDGKVGLKFFRLEWKEGSNGELIPVQTEEEVAPTSGIAHAARIYPMLYTATDKDMQRAKGNNPPRWAYKDEAKKQVLHINMETGELKEYVLRRAPKGWKPLHQRYTFCPLGEVSTFASKKVQALRDKWRLEHGEITPLPSAPSAPTDAWKRELEANSLAYLQELNASDFS